VVPEGQIFGYPWPMRLKKVSPNNHFEALSWHVVVYGNAWFVARFGANQEKKVSGLWRGRGTAIQTQTEARELVAGGPASFP
jgi:hypothetical protein